MISTCSSSSSNPILLNVVIENVIFPNLSLSELGVCSRVCKIWKEMAKKHISAFSHLHAFGPKEWHTYFGAYLRNVPRLPLNIAEVLNSPCPFWPDKKVYETHVLVLVPETVNGQHLTLKTLGDLVKKPFKGNVTQYNILYLGEYIDSPASSSYWVLLTRDVIEGSSHKCFQDQQSLIEKHVLYEVPPILDATICIFMEYVRYGIRLYSNSNWTYTRCKEKYDDDWQRVVGGFGPDGLDVAGGDIEISGIGGYRKL